MCLTLLTLMGVSTLGTQKLAETLRVFQDPFRPYFLVFCGGWCMVKKPMHVVEVVNFEQMEIFLKKKHL